MKGMCGEQSLRLFVVSHLCCALGRLYNYDDQPSCCWAPSRARCPSYPFQRQHPSSSTPEHREARPSPLPYARSAAPPHLVPSRAYCTQAEVRPQRGLGTSQGQGSPRQTRAMGWTVAEQDGKKMRRRPLAQLPLCPATSAVKPPPPACRHASWTAPSQGGSQCCSPCPATRWSGA